MATAATIGSLRAEMSANAAAFSRDMGKARDSVRQASASIDRNFKSLNTGLGAIQKGFRLAAGAAGIFGVALGTTALVNFIKRSVDAADEIAKTADKLGVGTEALQELRYAADLAGVSTQTFDLALQRFTRRAAEAANGTGEAKDAFKEMGIELRGANGQLRPAEDLLGDVADAMARTTNAGVRLRLAFKLFDSEGVAVVNMLKGGRAALEATRKEARDLGLVLDDNLVRNAEKAHDALSRMEKIVAANFMRLALQLAPTIIRIGEEFANAAPKIRLAVDAIADFFGAESLLSVGALEKKIAEIEAQIDSARNTALGRLRQGLDVPDVLLKGPLTSGAALLDRFIGISVPELEQRLAELKALRDQALARDEAARKALTDSGDTAAAQEQASAFSKVRDRLLEEFEALTKTDEERQISIALRQAEVKAGTAQAQTLIDIIRATNLESAAIDELMAELDAEEKAREDAAKKQAGLTKQRAEAKSQVLQEIAQTQELIAAYGEGEDAVNAVRDAYVVLNAAKAANINLSSAEGQEFAANVRRLEELKRQLGELEGGGKKVSEEMRDLSHVIGTAFEDAIINGERLSDVLAALEQDIIRIGLRAAITKPLETFVGNLFQGNGTSGSGGLFGAGGFFANLASAFSGLFAEGGTIKRGHWGIVGERGPELAFAGGHDLGVVPNDAMGGNNIYVDVSAPMDPNTAQMTGWQIADAIESQLARRRR